MKERSRLHRDHGDQRAEKGRMDIGGHLGGEGRVPLVKREAVAPSPSGVRSSKGRQVSFYLFSFLWLVQLERREGGERLEILRKVVRNVSGDRSRVSSSPLQDP